MILITSVCIHSMPVSCGFFSEEEISWTLDGEFGGNLRDVRIKVAHKAYEIIVPAGKEDEKVAAVNGDSGE